MLNKDILFVGSFEYRILDQKSSIEMEIICSSNSMLLMYLEFHNKHANM